MVISYRNNVVNISGFITTHNTKTFISGQDNPPPLRPVSRQTFFPTGAIEGFPLMAFTSAAFVGIAKASTFRTRYWCLHCYASFLIWV
jgi:hypothetical protein